MKAGLEAAAAWLNRRSPQAQPPKRPRAYSGTQVRCAQCADGTRSCVYCFGHGYTLSTDGVEVECEPCARTGRTRCPACRGEAFVRGY